MGKHLQHDLDELKREILEIGDMVQKATDKAITALTARQPHLADEVIASDRVIDQHEVHVEIECMKILALHQPVAADLRFVVAVLKVNNDLERIGDLAANIAERAKALSNGGEVGPPVDFTDMARRAGQMVRQSLEALVQLDPELARQVCADDEAVDNAHRNMILQLRSIMEADRSSINRGISNLWVSRSLERIADLATNIAEDVVFLVEGEVIRHGLGRQV